MVKHFYNIVFLRKFYEYGDVQVMSMHEPCNMKKNLFSIYSILEQYK